LNWPKTELFIVKSDIYESARAINGL